jgi:hypothetical protein
MEVHEGTVKSLIRALARGDLPTVEECAVALASGGKVHAPYRDEEMWPRQRLLAAWRYALPPYHRNPARKAIVDRRTIEKRLVGCYASIVSRGARDIDAPELNGTIVEDDGDGWTLQIKQPSKFSNSLVSVPIYVPLDSIAICDIHVNPGHLELHRPPEDFEGSPEDYVLGLPGWDWFKCNQECGLAW